MNRLALVSTFVLAFGAAPASATLQLAFADGAATFFCADQTACDLDGAAKNLLLINTTVGSIKIEGTFAASAPDQLSVSNLTITNLSSSTQTLQMAVGDTGFLPPVALIRSSASATFNTGGDTISLSFFADPLNGQPAGSVGDLPGSLLFNTGAVLVTEPDSLSGTHDSLFSALAPFSMSENAILTLAGDASVTGFNESMRAVIPEPSTWAMLAIGFVALGLGSYRHKRRSNAFSM